MVYTRNTCIMTWEDLPRADAQGACPHAVPRRFLPTADPLTIAEIVGALARLIESPTFRASPRLVSLLRFIVERAVSGETVRLKGYTIAVEAFGRAADFDPQFDPIVRVEAGRLRRQLERYYAGEGAGEAVVIELPRGGYVPIFRRRNPQRFVCAPPPWRDGTDGACSTVMRALAELCQMRVGALSAEIAIVEAMIEQVRALSRVSPGPGHGRS